MKPQSKWNVLDWDRSYEREEKLSKRRPKLKKGDRVVVLEPGGHNGITKGRHYIIRSVEADLSTGQWPTCSGPLAELAFLNGKVANTVFTWRLKKVANKKKGKK